MHPRPTGGDSRSRPEKPMTTQADECIVVLCTCPDGETAVQLARGLVEQRLAACVNVIDSVRSIYRWRGETTEDSEVLLVIKAPAAHYERLEQAIVASHPYELPEIIAVPIKRGFEQYLQWINEP